MKKRVLSLLLTLLLVLGLLPEGAWAEEEMIQIGTAEELTAFRDRVNGGERTLCAKLTADIELSGEWTPIGTQAYAADQYCGTFDGDYHTISGLSINASSTNQGLFGAINGATIKNLNVEGDVSSTKAYVGGIVGKIQQGTIENCSFKGSVSTQMTGSSAYVGGIAGYAGNSSSQTATIDSCVNLGSVDGGVAGGIVGYAKFTAINACYNTGAVKGKSRSGGIAGQLQNSCTGSNCYNIGEVKGSETSGGICDFLYSSSALNNCYGDGTISGTGTGTVTGGGTVSSAENLAAALGDAFTTDEQGNVILVWQAGKEPSPTPTPTPTPEPTLTPVPTPEPTPDIQDGTLPGTLYPVCGTDTNIEVMANHMLEESGTTAKLLRVQARGATDPDCSAIADDGEITYFYADPDSFRSIWYGDYDATFRLTKGEQTEEKTVRVIVYWDTARVKTLLQKEILRKIELPEQTETEISLPKVIDRKLWAQVTWESSDPAAIFVSSKNQTTSDTLLYGPFVGEVHRGTLAQTVTLTARVNFQRVNDTNGGKEPPIQLTQTYAVTVLPVDNTEKTAVESALREKLEAGLDTTGLRDTVTGNLLDPEHVIHDIQFPTTRDFKIDGKYYPVTITSSNPDVIVAPDVNNAARVEVYRPMPGETPVDVTLTVTITEKASGISASKDIPVTVQPLTQGEIDAELALMERVKAHYFDGIRGSNAAADAITTDLNCFFEVYAGENGELVWARNHADRVNRGIVPVPMNGWEQTEQWRLFRSSNPEVITHENLLVTRQSEHKAVTVTSYLSSETLGKYAERYPENADLQKLYYQPVSVDLVVTGTDPNGSTPAEERLTVTFTLRGNGSFGFTQTYRDLSEGTTVFEIFSRALTAHGYTYAGHGTYIEAITTPTGVTLSELDEGENSGWMYRINGAIPNTYMGARILKNGDTIEVFYTGDFTNESGYAGGWDSVNIKDRETPLAGASGFVDVPETAWYAEAVEYVCDEGLMVGVSGDRFAPGGDLSRAMLAAILYRMEESPAVTAGTDFADVPEDTWYTGAIAWGGETEILSGMGDGTFLPNRGVTRQELVSILYRYARYRGMDMDEKQPIGRFSDADRVAPWGYDAVAWAVANGLLCGTEDGRLNPNDNATRAEAAVIFRRFVALP